MKAKRVNEEARHKPYIYIIVGMASLLAFATIVQIMVPHPEIIYDTSLNILPTPAGAEKYPGADEPMCSTQISPVLDESSKIKYSIMTPRVLPEGYSLQGVDVIDSNGVEMITLYYWNKPLCDISKNLQGGPALNGAIVVRIANFLKVPDTYAQMIDDVNKIVPKYDFQKLVIKGIAAIGNRPGIATLDDEVLPYPGRIFVTTNNMLYAIEANMPLEDLAKIAESIN
jgi:hypothetical protein